MSLKESLWVEKYRPKKIEDLVLPEDYLRIFKQYIEKQEIPNLLFYGPAGGGKTTMAEIICSKYGVIKNRTDNVLEVNGSSKRCRGINYVDEVVEPFLKIPPAGKDKYRIVFIDEGDNLTEDSFKSLRSVIEKYSKRHGRFIITANYFSKFPEPILSRFVDFEFKQISMNFVTDYCKKVLDSENIKYDIENLKFVINALYPDVRRIINRLYRSCVNNELKIDKKSISTTEKLIIGTFLEMMDELKNKNMRNISSHMNTFIELLHKYDLDYKKLYTDLFFNKNVSSPVKIVINKYANSHNYCLVPSMHFMAMIRESIEVLRKYGVI